jgi:hypothetical protein
LPLDYYARVVSPRPAAAGVGAKVGESRLV